MLASLAGEGRMDRFEGIKIFVRVVESGSFSAVARELGTSPGFTNKVGAAHTADRAAPEPGYGNGSISFIAKIA